MITRLIIILYKYTRLIDISYTIDVNESLIKHIFFYSYTVTTVTVTVSTVTEANQSH